MNKGSNNGPGDVEFLPLKPLIEQIEQAARRAANLTTEMLAYSGRGSVEVESVDLNALVGEMSALLQSAVCQNVSLSKDFAGAPPAIQADATQLRQIVMNLIMNASDACRGGDGKMIIRTRVTELGARHVDSFACNEIMRPGMFVCVEVEDNGIGMDAETQRQLFDPFFSTKELGSGLGLSATLGIVRAHRGGITVKSAPDQGTVVRVALPVGPATEKADPEPAPATVESLPDSSTAAATN